MFFINSTKQNAGVLGWPLKILNCRHSKVFLICSVPLYPNGHISLAFCASSQIFLLESHKAVACPVRTLSVHCNTIATMATTFGRTHYPQRCQPLETYNLETVYFAVPPTSNTPCLITTNRPSPQIMAWVQHASTLYKELQKRAHSKTSIVKMQISEKWR